MFENYMSKISFKFPRGQWVKVTVLVYGWRQTISNKSKWQLRVFPLSFLNIPYFLLVVYKPVYYADEALNYIAYGHNKILCSVRWRKNVTWRRDFDLTKDTEVWGVFCHFLGGKWPRGIESIFHYTDFLAMLKFLCRLLNASHRSYFHY